MMNPHNQSIPRLAILAILLIAPFAGLNACSEEAPPPPPVQTSAIDTFQDDFSPPEQFTQPKTPLQLASGVTFPDERRPVEDTLALSIAALANSLATGDVQGMSKVLTDDSQAVLNQLVETGLWLTSTDNIQQVRVVTVDDSSETTRVGLGIQEASGAYLLAWEGSAVGDHWRFTGLAIEPRTADDVTALDGAMLALRALPNATALEAELDPNANDPRRDEDQNGSTRGRSSRGGGGPGR